MNSLYQSSNTPEGKRRDATSLLGAPSAHPFARVQHREWTVSKLEFTLSGVLGTLTLQLRVVKPSTPEDEKRRVPHGVLRGVRSLEI